jgi:glycosyltransferase involved in cell wall biosynthesis/SAM-dependent methyltransferase
VYNGERYLEQALQSLLAQTFEDFELIVSDNGSTDATPAICRDWAGRDPRVRYFRSTDNRGAAWNFNHVFARARGRYFKWAAHDDLCLPALLDRCVAVLDADPQAVLCYSRCRRLDGGGRLGRVYDDGPFEEPLASERFRRLVSEPHRCLAVFGLMRREVLARTPRIGAYVGSDRNLLAELGLHGPLRQVEEVLFVRRDHPDNSMVRYANDRELIAWFDPGRAGKGEYPMHRVVREYARSVRRAPLAEEERERCLGHLRAWVERGRHYTGRRVAAVLAEEARRLRATREGATPAAAGEGPRCLVCGGAAVAPVLSLPGLPVDANVPAPSREQALAAARADLELVACPACGHGFNLAFDPARVAYAPGYENALEFSPRVRAYLAELAARLAAGGSLRGKRVVEIGCGRGYFLGLLCAQGGCEGEGYDPSLPADLPMAAGRVRFHRATFPGPTGSGPADLLVCRHVLEHLADPVDFLGNLARHLPAGARLYLEVPNGDHLLRTGAVWDLVYEHVSLFTAASLVRAAEAAGYRVRWVEEAFDGQFLSLEATVEPGAGGPSPGAGTVAALAPAWADFGRRCLATLATWHARLAAEAAAGQRGVVWGAGSKGVSFLDHYRDAGCLLGAVDVNPHKQGRFAAGSGHPILVPEGLTGLRPDFVVVMNRAYEAEVRATLDRLGLAPRRLLA